MQEVISALVHLLTDRGELIGQADFLHRSKVAQECASRVLRYQLVDKRIERLLVLRRCGAGRPAHLPPPPQKDLTTNKQRNIPRETRPAPLLIFLPSPAHHQIYQCTEF